MTELHYEEIDDDTGDTYKVRHDIACTLEKWESYVKYNFTFSVTQAINQTRNSEWQKVPAKSWKHIKYNVIFTVANMIPNSLSG
ncbi:hypothetical protein Tco_1370719 [Tanacetum coccineum]